MILEHKQQLSEIIITGFGFVLLLTIIEILKRRKVLHAEAARKSVHISVGFILAALPLFMDRWQVVLTNAGFFGGVVLMTGILHVFTAVHSVKRWTIGEFLYPLSTGLVAAVFTDLRVYTFAVLVLGISDGLAGLIGKTWGGKGYRIWRGRKSFLGNLVFLTTSFFLITAFWVTTHGFTLGLVPAALGLALMLTAAETFFSGGFDNIAVTLSAALVAWFILQM